MADMTFITDEIRKSGPAAVVVGFLMVAMAIGGAFLPVGAREAAWVPYGKWTMLAALVALGVFLVNAGFKPPEKHAAIVLLRDTPGRIVWAHIEKRKTNGQHTATFLKLYTDDGKKLFAPVPRNQEGERRGMALVSEVAPQATIGFHPDYEARFAKDPASLRRA